MSSVIKVMLNEPYDKQSGKSHPDQCFPLEGINMTHDCSPSQQLHLKNRKLVHSNILVEIPLLNYAITDDFRLWTNTYLSKDK